MPAKAKKPDNSWKFIKFLRLEEKQCEIVTSKRWGSRRQGLRGEADPADDNPANFKAVFLDPLMGETQGDHSRTSPTRRS